MLPPASAAGEQELDRLREDFQVYCCYCKLWNLLLWCHQKPKFFYYKIQVFFVDLLEPSFPCTATVVNEEIMKIKKTEIGGSWVPEFLLHVLLPQSINIVALIIFLSLFSKLIIFLDLFFSFFQHMSTRPDIIISLGVFLRPLIFW